MYVLVVLMYFGFGVRFVLLFSTKVKEVCELMFVVYGLTLGLLVVLLIFSTKVWAFD
jgi:hypothetical protein